MKRTRNRPGLRVRPRNASSLVLYRRRAGGIQVLLGRRATRHRFMPDLYVFPGGRVDPGDSTRRAASELRSGVATQLERQFGPPLARGLAIAAVRETHEETGLTIGRLQGGELLPDLASLDYIARAITPSDSEIRFHARFFLAEGHPRHGQARDSRELLDLRWFEIEEALALPIIDVTDFVLRSVRERLAGTATPGVPLLHYRRGVRHVRYE